VAATHAVVFVVVAYLLKRIFRTWENMEDMENTENTENTENMEGFQTSSKTPAQQMEAKKAAAAKM
jgi:hypothetical protein